MTTIPEALEAYRKDRGWRAGDMAMLLGLHRSHYSEVISGKRAELPLNATRRAYALGIDPDILLQMKEK